MAPKLGMVAPGAHGLQRREGSKRWCSGALPTGPPSSLRAPPTGPPSSLRALPAGPPLPELEEALDERVSEWATSVAPTGRKTST
jgi:hypothetical protein